MTDRPNGPTTLLTLPWEIRHQIFTDLFRSTTFHSHRPSAQYLSILRVCRQTYHEAAPLVLPNARVYCKGNAAMLRTLGRMNPEQITQLRHLIVSHSSVGFNLDLRSDDRRAGDVPEEDDGWVSETGDDLAYWDEDADVRYFQLGALLSLFPGLRLDLLEVFFGAGGSVGPYTAFQTTDCFGSLLEADGYRRLWMHAAAGDDGQAWVDVPSAEDWGGIIERKFKPYAGWKVQIGLRGRRWEDRRDSELWGMTLGTGITLVEAKYDERDAGDDDSDGHSGEDVTDIVVNRGHAADFSVKEVDGPVLRCMVTGDGSDCPRYFRRASDALRKLVRENGWEAIEIIDVYHVSCCGSKDHPNV
ncbi:uncharacterized protein DNG_09237 [Cephalotrichum gorgonifer]|uniref:F-box domain-containing protein n=1 Tax=Cephalotrichum gorgonifer TaxID=2041049 RepID=A0AAE8N5G0_9PEZI|nr:uncharacterized protein DNG_09237 [Cephalotrichum gorgonifer]